MRFAEVNLFGVYVAPVAPMMVAAWLVLIPLRLFAARLGVFQHVWHPALLIFATYVILLSACILLVGAL